MKTIPALLLFTLISTGATLDTTESDDRINSIDTKPSVRLDPYIRKALLKALTELEQNDNFTTDTDITETTSSDTEILKTGDDIIQTTPVEKADDDKVQIHSFIVNGQSAFGNFTKTSSTNVDKNISILSSTAGNVEKDNTATLPTQASFNEIFQTQQSGINVQQVRSVQQSSTSGAENDMVGKQPTNKVTSTTITTTTTTTTTTPKPTHNVDGENIEDVDKRDVQVFQAPLVAAFTVHQDEQGLPKKVVPIFQQTNREAIKPLVPPNNIQNDILQQSIPLSNFNLNPARSNIVQPDFVSQQLALQKQLEEKQRILEEQLRLLQLQQRQQEELLRKQQFLFQQKEVQRQQQLITGQELLRRQQPQKPIQQNQLLNQQNSQVTIQQSVPFEPISLTNQQLSQPTQQSPNSLPFQQPLQNNFFGQQESSPPNFRKEPFNSLANQQQLPNREAVDFLLNLRNQQKEQFPLQDNHLPQGIGNFLKPNNNLNLQQSNFNQLRPIDEQFKQKQSTRVFRQESGVGNFGLNNQDLFRFQTLNPPAPNNRFTQNRQQNQFELNHLLYQSAINGRNHEDLNIVTKVLSLNHGVPFNNNIHNGLAFENRRPVRTLL